ncbi:Hypothetical_protein [Hexamita inflata]|uniref:Hypothetical_protein n=1 Tax=Hexamita inflata TaxID=28002 RepID=A0ABP1HKV8_9EUKA
MQNSPTLSDQCQNVDSFISDLDACALDTSNLVKRQKFIKRNPLQQYISSSNQQTEQNELESIDLQINSIQTLEGTQNDNILSNCQPTSPTKIPTSAPKRYNSQQPVSLIVSSSQFCLSPYQQVTSNLAKVSQVSTIDNQAANNCQAQIDQLQQQERIINKQANRLNFQVVQAIISTILISIILGINTYVNFCYNSVYILVASVIINLICFKYCDNILRIVIQIILGFAAKISFQSQLQTAYSVLIFLNTALNIIFLIYTLKYQQQKRKNQRTIQHKEDNTQSVIRPQMIFQGATPNIANERYDIDFSSQDEAQTV